MCFNKVEVTTVSVVADGSVKVETFQVAVKVFAVMLRAVLAQG